MPSASVVDFGEPATTCRRMDAMVGSGRRAARIAAPATGSSMHTRMIPMWARTIRRNISSIVMDAPFVPCCASLRDLYCLGGAAGQADGVGHGHLDGELT